MGLRRLKGESMLTSKDIVSIHLEKDFEVSILVAEIENATKGISPKEAHEKYTQISLML